MKEISPIYQGLRNEANSFGENNDCGVKALAVATGRSYADCHSTLKNYGRKNGKGTYVSQMINAARDLGFNLIKIDCHHRGLRSLSRDLPEKGNFVVWVTGHFAGVSDGKIHDWSDGRCLRIKQVFQAIPIGSDIPLHSFEPKEKNRTRKTQELYKLVHQSGLVVAKFKRFPTKVFKVIQLNGYIQAGGLYRRGEEFSLKDI